jgi:DNA polymerase III epsilon subunit-like protein
MRLLLFDTETTGLPKSRESAIKLQNNWPHIVSIGWIVMEDLNIIKKEYYLVKPEWDIPDDASKIHGITKEKAMEEGLPLSEVINKFIAEPYDIMIAHNMNFDLNVLINAIIWDLKLPFIPFTKTFCTMEFMKPIMKLTYANNRGIKSPKLSEMYEFITKKKPENLHNSLVDTMLIADCIIESKVLQEGLNIGKEIAVNDHKKRRTTLIL